MPCLVRRPAFSALPPPHGGFVLRSMSIAYRLPGSEILGVEITTFTMSDMPLWWTAQNPDWTDIPVAIQQRAQIAMILREIARDDYEGWYLRTPHWHQVSRWRKKIARFRCEVSDQHTGILDVHHKTYDHLGCEPPEDLEVLCRECHKARHDALRNQIRESLR